MSANVRVDFHCHTSFSDGSLTPRELAELLAADDVQYAALTDHDTLSGLDAFHRAAGRRGIGHVTGLEITTQFEGREAHLLAYGFDPEHSHLRETLQSIRRGKPPAAHSVTEAMRERVENDANNNGTRPAPGGRIEIADAIRLVHDAGGKAFLAHPLTLEPDPERLSEMLATLRQMGLDGIEALYGLYTPVQRERLCAQADELGLLVSAGSDVHTRPRNGRATVGVEMPAKRWKQFRDAVCCGTGSRSTLTPSEQDQPRLRMKRRHFLLHVVLPTVLAIGLFAGAIFGVLLPAFEDSLLERKRETIHELTQSAMSIIAAYHADAQTGAMPVEEAMEKAAERVGQLRYGPEGLDYFWIQDMQPRIIMHPWRPDLIGQDVSEFRDPRGERIFVRFVEVVREQGGGYVDYVWQWKDDPQRFAPKESYVDGFEPWGWIVGTGLYTEDVQAEIARLQASLARVSLAITAFIVLLLLYVLRQSLRLERSRTEAEEGLRQSTARYRSLVEAHTEGTLLVQEGRLRYANPMMLEIARCGAEELHLLDLEDLLPRTPENENAWEEIERVRDGEEAHRGFEGVIHRRDGGRIECVLAVSRMTMGGSDGLILLVTPIGEAAGRGRATPAADIAEAAPVGLLRARATAQGTIVRHNQAAGPLLETARDFSPGDPLSLGQLFPDDDAWEEFLSEARAEGGAERLLHLSTTEPRNLTARLNAAVVRDDEGKIRYLDCTLEDVTTRERHEARRQGLIDRLQASLLFLHEPVSHVRAAPVLVRLGETVESVARKMTRADATAVLVQSDEGEVVGIVTDEDMRERVLSRGIDRSTTIGRVMSAPVKAIREQADIYEALLAMESEGVLHLALEDPAGEVTGIIHHRELLQFPSYGPMVLAREIRRADRADQVISAALRAPALAAALTDSGAPPGRSTRMLTSVCDAATQRFIELAQEELGPAPADFCFLGLGSHGREELTITSDQDNALIYDDSAAGDESASEYFVALGRRVCGWLDEAGYPYCRGEIMAQNPRWSQPLSKWREYFSEWIRSAEPRQILEFVAFFDFRSVSGDRDLADQLRDHVFAETQANQAFLIHLAQNAQRYKPPMRLFGRIIAGGTGSQEAQILNVKEAAMPIIGFARVYALREGVESTNTVDRLDALSAAGELADASRDETVAAFTNLMRLRLEQQAEALRAVREPDNSVAYRDLSDVERTLVNQAFAQIAAVQKRISHDFLGDMTP